MNSIKLTVTVCIHDAADMEAWELREAIVENQGVFENAMEQLLRSVTLKPLSDARIAYTPQHPDDIQDAWLEISCK